MTTPPSTIKEPSSGSKTVALITLVLSVLAIVYWLVGYISLFTADFVNDSDTSMTFGLSGLLVLITALVATPFVVVIFGIVAAVCRKSDNQAARLYATVTLVLQGVIIALALPALVTLLSN